MDLLGVAPGVALRAGAMASVPAAVFGAWQVRWWKDELLRLRLRCLAGLLEVEAREPRVLNEAAVFNCIACGKPLGTEKMVNAMLGKLAGHSMFAAPGALDRLKMCADCRVVDLVRNEKSVDIRDV